MKQLPRAPLAQLPTPIHELTRLRSALGPTAPRLFVKRDDQTGLALGGNKTRKLEFVMADAVAQGADVVITAGAGQSNHCRQTAAAAAQLGLDCELVLGGDPPTVPNGNLLLDIFCGARLHWTQPHQRNATMQRVAEELRQQGKTPYVIPVGASNGLGAVGYIYALRELDQQLAAQQVRVDTLIVPTSSGGTQAGLALGAKLCEFSGTVLGISIDQQPDQQPRFESDLAEIASEAATHLEIEIRCCQEEFHVNYDYLGAGYGVVGDLERKAIRLAAQTEGLIVGPVYTGRALGGLLDMVRQGAFTADQNVLFWHTGGAPALFAYTEDLLR